MEAELSLGQGVGWRPELALTIDRRESLGFVELLAENVPGRTPAPVERLRARGAQVVVHGIGLSLGGAEPLDLARVERMAQLAVAVGAPLVSEHACFVRAGGLESGHLLPLPRTRAALDVLADNVAAAQRILPVPLAIENIACLFEWPGAEMDEAAFLSELVARTGCRLLLDVANLYANARNLGWDAARYLDRLPLDAVAYVHVAGGVERGGLYHDTHAHAIPAGVLELVEELGARRAPPGVLIERDDHFPPPGVLEAELDAVAAALARGAARREAR